jgi:ATP-binding cassette, subfamily C, bacterial
MMSDNQENEPIQIEYRRVRTPTMIQMEVTECGAVALGIVAAYYGRYVPIEDLRIACSVSRDGSNAYNIIEAAQSLGLEAEGYSCELEALYEIELPVILFWKFEHFLVLEGFSKDKVFVNDPATGPRTITYNDLDQSFTGVVLTFKPGPSFVKSGRPYSITEALYKRLYHVKKPFLYILIAALCLLIPNLALPALVRVFVDDVLINHYFSWKLGITIGMLTTIIVLGLLTYMQGFILNRLNIKLAIQFSCNTLWLMLRLPYSFFTQHYPGELTYRVTLNDNVSYYITGSLVALIIDVILVVAYVFVIFYYDFIIGGVVFISIGLYALLIRIVYRSRIDAYTRYQADFGKSSAYSLGALESIETLKATGAEFKFFSMWIGYYTKVLKSLQEIGKKDIILITVPAFLDFITTTTFIGVGGWRILNGYLTIGMFSALLILLRNLKEPVSEILNLIRSFQMFKVDLNRLDDIMTRSMDPLMIKESSVPEEIPEKLEGYVELHNISFGYSPRDLPVLQDIFFTLNPGKIVALVGPTGCGKSTITKLISGLYEPWSGEILFDGKRLDQIPRSKITNSIAVIEQESLLFSGTVRDNLSFMDTQVSQEDMLRASKDACIHDEILAKKGGYDYFIDENGMNLSGGQRQRLEIARGLIKNPSIIIMDESTSSLDSDIESQIITNIRRRGCTILMIAHRLSTIRNCDEIAVMDMGRIIAVGTHAELREIPGLYRDLIQSEHLDF